MTMVTLLVVFKRGVANVHLLMSPDPHNLPLHGLQKVINVGGVGL